MRIAWFRHTAPDTSDPLDDTAPLVEALRASHEIDVVVEHDAHDFVWQHVLRPWDLCVFELDNTRAHQFVVAYLLNYPGVVILRSVDVTTLRVPLLACASTSISAALSPSSELPELVASSGSGLSPWSAARPSHSASSTVRRNAAYAASSAKSRADSMPTCPRQSIASKSPIAAAG